MKWKSHIQNIISKTRHMIFSFIALRDILPLYQLRLIYEALFVSVWSYGILVWGGTKDIEPLEILNRKILKVLINKPKRFSTASTYKISKVMNVEQIYCTRLLKYMIKKQKIQFEVQSRRPTRESNKYKAISSRKNTAIAETCHEFLGPRLFNLMPIDVRRTFYHDTALNHFYKIVQWIQENKSNLIIAAKTEVAISNLKQNK